MAIVKFAVDEEEASSSGESDVDDGNAGNMIDDSFRAAVTVATTSDHPFFESFVSVSSKDLDNSAKVNFDGSEDLSFRLPSYHDSRKSSRSFEISDSYGEDTTIPNVKSNNRTGPSRKQRFLQCALFSLLIIAEILAVLVAREHHAVISYANIIVIGAIAIILWLYDFRTRKQEIILIKSVNRSQAIVNSLFPEIVRDRIMEEGHWGAAKSTGFTNIERRPSLKTNNQNVPDASTTVDHQIAEDLTNHDESDASDSSYIGSNSGRIGDDLIFKNNAERFSPTHALPKPYYPKRLSNASSSANTIISDAHGNTDAAFYPSHNKIGNLIVAGSTHSSQPYTSKPIADYFPSATILFADIVGFTSWASVREPVQVFELLETVYRRFDRIAKKKGIFKVETIGDCYVAAAGLPNVMDGHAVAMASFARRCLETMLETVAELEQSLGPGTTDLGTRMGIHSGSIIGGVLRGAKSRYQLFGDTMNTASRIESTSSKNKIQVSEQTAELIIEAGKRPWLELRREPIFAKGKGELKTYWLTTEGPSNLSEREKMALPALLKMCSNANIDPGFIQKRKSANPDGKRERLVDYHTNVLKGLLKRLADFRCSINGDSSDSDANANKIWKTFTLSDEASATKPFAVETMEAILYPTSTPIVDIDLRRRTIDPSVSKQLRELISRVSSWYRDDLSFHTFEHASHTVLSISKFLAAIKTTQTTTDSVLNKTKLMVTHPLTQFVLVYVALVHDTGSNDIQEARLVTAEKSFRRAWSLFLEPAFRDLRRCICRSRQDFDFFRRLLGKSIVAVSIKTSGAIKDQAETLIDSPSMENPPPSIENQVASRKAMSILETLLQVSDGSYALQHYPVFVKWNKLLFKEVYGRYKLEAEKDDNKTKEDPSVGWYVRELESFDERLHLIRRLRESGVFNKLTDVYLNTTIANRRQWERKGKPIVKEYISDSIRTNDQAQTSIMEE